jgi:mannosyltransferase
LKTDKTKILLLLLVAFALRVWGLADHSIWWDEGLAAWAARLPVKSILHWTAHDVHPPLYFLLLRGWWSIVGDGEFVLRFPSVFMGTLAVGLIYRLGRSLGKSRAGLLAALFLTLSRFAVSWSQEMRMYIWDTALTAGALWATVQLWRSHDRGWRAWIAYVLTIAAGLWSLFLMISVPLIANLAFPIVWVQRGRSRRLLIRWTTAQLAAGVLFVPWLVYALPRMPTWSSSEPFSPLFFVHLYTTMLAVGIPTNLEAYTLLTGATFAALAAGALALWRSRRTPAQSAGLATLVLGLVLPALVVYVISLPIHLYYAPRLAPRYLLPLSICFYTLLGWGLAVLAKGRRWAAALGSAVVVTVALSGLAPLYPGRARRDDYVSVAATLRAHVQPGDAVILHTDKDWPIFSAHYAGTWRGVPYGAPVETATVQRVVAPVWKQSDGVWLVITPDALRTDPDSTVSAWLQTQAVATRTWHFGESALSLYARTSARAEKLYDLSPDFRIADSGIQARYSHATAGSGLVGAETTLPRYLSGDTAHLFLYWDPPPDKPVDVQLRSDGDLAVWKTVTVPAPQPAYHTLTRQHVAVPLTTDLPGGRYRLTAQVEGADGPPLEVARFTLVRRNSTAQTETNALAPGDITHPLDLLLGEQIRLLGYDLPETAVRAGGTIELTLYWQAVEPIRTRYKVFTHLVGETYNASTNNFLWGQQDNEPVSGQTPTTTWAPEGIIIDSYTIPVAADAPPGPYQIEVGMYGLVDGARLPVLAHRANIGDHVLLEQIEVKAE